VSQEKRSNAYASGGNTVCLLDLLVAYMQRKKLQSPAYAYLTGTCYKSVQSVLTRLGVRSGSCHRNFARQREVNLFFDQTDVTNLGSLLAEMLGGLLDQPFRH
jgi:hypothetical protein